MLWLHGSLLLILIASLWPDALCCLNNQRTTYCQRSGKVKQTMCSGVDPWPCNWPEFRCACAPEYRRRRDGKCVDPSECENYKKEDVDSGTNSAADSGIDGSTDSDSEDSKGIEKTVHRDTPESPEQQEGTHDDALYFSGGENGCPDNAVACAQSCKDSGYHDGHCDRFLGNYCYCSGRLRKQKGTGNEIKRLSWPYGRVVSTGELIWQLRDSHGCRENEQECFTACNRLSVRGAFCGYKPPHHCFCEAYVPQSFSSILQEELYRTSDAGTTNCDSSEFCDSYCTSSGYSGGFCPSDEQTKCYCYQMYPYGESFSPSFRQEAHDLVTEDYSELAVRFLQSRQTISLVLISTFAWMGSHCHCMRSTFEETSGDNTLRTVECYVSLDAKNHAISSHRETANVRFRVRHQGGATRIFLESDSKVLPFALRDSYLVLSATRTCIVVQLSDLIRGEPLCALWGHDDAESNDETACFETMRRVCMQPVSDAYIGRHQCAQTYADEVARYRGTSQK